MRFTIYDLRFTRLGFVLVLFVLLCLAVWTAKGDGTPVVPASAAEVAAGVVHTKYVAPDTLAGRLTQDPNVAAFCVSNGITAPGTVTALNSIVGIFKAAGRWADVKDVVLLGAQFRPTNHLTFMGRVWTNTPGLVDATYGDPNYATFNGKAAIDITGFSLSNYLVVVTWRLTPAFWSTYDAEINPPGIQGASKILLSVINTNDYSGEFVQELSTYNNGDGLLIFPTGGGIVTNNWYRGGYPNSDITSSNAWKIESALTANVHSPILPGVMALGGSSSGVFKLWMNDMDGFFDVSAAHPQTFTTPAGYFNQGVMTTVRVGGDTNFTGTTKVWSASAVSTNDNAHMDVQIIFVCGTNDAALMDLCYQASFWGDTRRTLATVMGGSSIFDPNTTEASHVNVSMSSNSMMGQLAYQNPQIRFLQHSQGGSGIDTILTNSLTLAPLPLSTILNQPPEFTRLVMTDCQRNPAYGGKKAEILHAWVQQYFTPLFSNNIPVWVWQDYLAGTNASSYSVIGSSNLIAVNQSFLTNTMYGRTFNMARHVTNRSLTNSSVDSIHMLLNGQVYSDIAKEFSGLGAITLMNPDTYTAFATGWTNFTAHAMTVYMTAGTSVQFKDASGNVYGPSTTTAVLVTMPLPPLGSFTGTSITATITDNSLQ